MILSFSRLLVASMQAICLEGLGGEKKVDPRLQETTFIQHTFGGHLRSKVLILKSIITYYCCMPLFFVILFFKLEKKFFVTLSVNEAILLQPGQVFDMSS